MVELFTSKKIKMIPQIISNQKRTNRVSRLMNELQAQGITEYKLWPSIEIYNKPRRTGINLAHKQIVEWAMLEMMPEVCIWEDDIRFPAADGWQYYLKNRPQKDFDLYLGGVYRGDIAEDGKLTRFTGMHCYIITEQFYDTFLKVPEELDIDGAMSGLGEFYCCNPFACIQWDGWSDNCQCNMDYSHLLKGRKIYGINC